MNCASTAGPSGRDLFRQFPALLGPRRIDRYRLDSLAHISAAVADVMAVKTSKEESIFSVLVHMRKWGWDGGEECVWGGWRGGS